MPKKLGPAYMDIIPSMSWLLVKESCLGAANEVFDGCGIDVTYIGQKHLELGSDHFVQSFVNVTISLCVSELDELCKITRTPASGLCCAYSWPNQQVDLPHSIYSMNCSLDDPFDRYSA